MIRLSDIAAYLDYGCAIAEKDYERAKRDLFQCIEIVKEAGEIEKVTLLLQFMGDTEQDMGNLSEALTYYQKAEINAPDSPFARIKFAKFLISRRADANAAMKKCDEAEEILRDKWHPDPNDLTEEEYKREINEIRNIGSTRR